MNSRRIVFVTLVALTLVSCAAPYNQDFALIEKGMNQQEVTRLIGKPISAESGPKDTKILYFRLSSSHFDTNGRNTREYFVVMTEKSVIGYGERKDSDNMKSEIQHFISEWNEELPEKGSYKQ